MRNNMNHVFATELPWVPEVILFLSISVSSYEPLTGLARFPIALTLNPQLPFHNNACSETVENNAD